MPKAPAIGARAYNTDHAQAGGGGSGPPDEESPEFNFPDPWADDRRRATLLQVLIGVFRAVFRPWRYGPSVRCPSCGARLTVQNPFEGVGYDAVHEYCCLSCSYTLMVPFFDGEVHD